MVGKLSATKLKDLGPDATDTNGLFGGRFHFPRPELFVCVFGRGPGMTIQPP